MNPDNDMLKNLHCTFDVCDVTTVANTSATIPAGRHLVIELGTGSGGVSVRPTGVVINISYVEWKRLQDEGKVRE